MSPAHTEGTEVSLLLLLYNITAHDAMTQAEAPAALPQHETDQGSRAELQQNFVYVTRSERRTRKNRKGKQQVHMDDGQLLQHRMDIIAARKAELLADNRLRQFLDAILPRSGSARMVTSALALGLGSVKDARPAQIQLAFFLLLCDRMSIPDVCTFDPIHIDADRALLSALSVVPLHDNLRGAYTVQHETTTLVFMPHCSRGLYENILRANWMPSGLTSLLLCCNELERYVGGLASVSMGSPCLRRAAGRLHVHPIPALHNSLGNSALNDLAVQSFVPLPYDTRLSGSPEGASDEQNQLALPVTSDTSFWVLPEYDTTGLDAELL